MDEWQLFFQEARLWWALAWPSSLGALAELLPWLINLSFVGHVSASSLASLSLTETWLYGFSVVIWSAFASAGSTLVSQAHGAKNLGALRGWGAMAVVAHLLAAGVVACVWVAGKPSLDGMGFPPDETLRAQSYTLFAIPALFLMAVQISAAVYLTGVQAPGIPLAAAVLGAAVDILFSYVLVLGVGGSGVLARGMADKLQANALAWVAGSAASLVACLMGVWWVRGREFDFGDGGEEGAIDGGLEPLLQGGGGAAAAGAPPRRRPAPGLAAFLASRERWCTFLRQLGPALATSCVESSQFTIISFLAASLGDAEIAAHNTMICFFEVVHTGAQGMAEATAVRVGFHLGRGDGEGARRAARVALAATGAWSALVAAAGFLLRGYLPLLFSNDARVVELSVALSPLMWVSYTLLGVGDAALGVLQGQGRAATETGISFFGTWCVGLPLAVGFWKLRWGGLTGLWGAMLAGYAVLAVGALALVWRSNWRRYVDDARKRVEDEEGEGEEETLLNT
jgi:Na+-driven multidrug efflux pump